MAVYNLKTLLCLVCSGLLFAALGFDPTELLKIQCDNLENPHFFFDGMCYELKLQVYEFERASNSGCHSIPNGHLAFIKNPKIAKLTFKHFERYKGGSQYGWSYYWVGLRQMDTSNEPMGGWSWFKGERDYKSADNIPWAMGEPNNNGPENCAASVVEMQGMLADIYCTAYPFYPLCQYESCSKDFENCERQACEWTFENKRLLRKNGYCEDRKISSVTASLVTQMQTATGNSTKAGSTHKELGFWYLFFIASVSLSALWLL